MKYISYKVDNDIFRYSFVYKDEIKYDMIPLRIDGKINKKALYIANQVRIEVEAEKLEIYDEIINEDTKHFYKCINNNIINSDVNYILGKMIAHSLKEKETINLSSILLNYEDELKKIEYLIEEIENFIIIKNSKSVKENILKLKNFTNDINLNFLIEEYYMPIINYKTKNIMAKQKRA